MKPSFRFLQSLAALFLLSASLTLSAADYTQYVNPFVGTGDHGHTFPGPVVPHGMIQPSPDTRIYGWDACSGYHYSDSTINGFSHTHLSGTGCGDYGDVLLMPTVGRQRIEPAAPDAQTLPYASRFSHDKETASPGYYSVMLDTYGVKAELTSTARAAIHRYTFPKSKDAGFILDLDYSLQGQYTRSMTLEIVNDTTIRGHKNTNSWAWRHDVYFEAVFSKPFRATVLTDTITDGKHRRPVKKALLKFATRENEQVLVKVAISAVDNEGARRNLSEIPGWDFDRVRNEAREAWNAYLSKIEVATADRSQMETFYSALYHTAIAPNLFTDIDGRYRALDRSIRTADPDTPMYTVYSLWDTFRALHPLFTIIQPDRNAVFIRNLLTQYEQGGILPMWELAGNYTGTMIGYHAVPVIVDAYAKGCRDFDARLALKAALRSAEYDTISPVATTRYLVQNALMTPSKYYKNTLGYIPYDKERESVAKGLEYAYNDWCISLLAKELGDTATSRRYGDLSQAYRHYFDPSVRFMRGKDSQGNWNPAFSPTLSSHRSDEYCEGTAWQWSWFVPHDPDGLIDLMGGREAFAEKLDSLFAVNDKMEGDRLSPDISGLIGQYAHGNEPSHHIIFLYNHIGRSWKTQELVDSVLQSLYHNRPEGLSGNEDCGQMSAWYVLNAMGFYQPCPGDPTYTIGRPLFDSVTIHLPNGRDLHIIAENNSRRNKYILSATLNDRRLERPYFTHEQLMQGGTLRFVMHHQPSEWNGYLRAGVIPAPTQTTVGNGQFVLTAGTPLLSNLKGREKERLDAYLQTLPQPFAAGCKKLKKNHETGAIVLRKDEKAGFPAEGYRLTVGNDGATIEAGDDAGLFYGLQTLLQYAEESDTLPALTINDSPRFAYRGFMMDVSRHFRTKEFIKKQMDAMAQFKLNRLHLHLTDAAGWRLEIKRYPRLTDFAAWRTAADWREWWKDGDKKYCEASAPGAYGGYYTADDIRELLSYAEERHITIIPEIEMPGHSEEVLAAYPELSCSGKPYDGSDFCVGNEETFRFLENVLTEVMELFPSEYIHIGGDEAGKRAWKTCPKCQQRMAEEGLANVDELQSYLVHRIERFLNDHGRQLIGWDEIMQGELAPNATVMSWRGEEGGLRAAQSEHKAIMTPGKYCYFDGFQDAPHSQKEAIGGYLPLSKVYSYNPVPASFTKEQAGFIYGVQANLWAEYIPTDEQYEFMTYPRLLALAEVAWSRPENKSYERFYPLALKANRRLTEAGYHTFDLNGEIGPRSESLRNVVHLGLGKPVIYNAPYSKSYIAQGDRTLTDGKRGDWTYNDGAWQGFIGRDRLDVTVDLEQPTEIHSVTADFIQVVNPDVFIPEEVIISVSDDDRNFREVARMSHTVDKSAITDFKQFTWNGKEQARYVRYQARAGKTHGGWVFTDEIIIR